MSSAAVIPRILEKEPRTVLLDEIHRTLIEGRLDTDTVLAVVNSGYRVGATRPVLVARGRDFKIRALPTFAPVAMAGNSPHLPQDTVDRSIRILLMPDVDGHAEDSDWEALDGEVKGLHRRVSQWADSVPQTLKTPRTGCRPMHGPTQGEMASADARGRAGRARRRTVWKDTVYTMAEADLEDAKNQREAGLRRQPAGLVLLQDLAQNGRPTSPSWRPRR